LDHEDYLRYLERIQFVPRQHSTLEPSLQLLEDLHQAHLQAVPFENLSIHYKEPIILDERQLFDKIVVRKRGGFCYELNGLFASLLSHLGFRVMLLSAGVAQADGGYSPDFDHLALLIRRVEGSDWLADVGFGDSFRRPLRLHLDKVQDGGDGKRYRLLHHKPDDYWIVAQKAGNQWASQYRFTLKSHQLADFSDRCHYQQCSPESHFTQRRICTLALPAGRMTLSDLRLITTVDGIRRERELLSEEEYVRALAELFGISLRHE
jgi:N-hydroxyarylamine O-acetyltransferase